MVLLRPESSLACIWTPSLQDRGKQMCLSCPRTQTTPHPHPGLPGGHVDPTAWETGLTQPPRFRVPGADPAAPVRLKVPCGR